MQSVTEPAEPKASVSVRRQNRNCSVTLLITERPAGRQVITYWAPKLSSIESEASGGLQSLQSDSSADSASLEQENDSVILDENSCDEHEVEERQMTSQDSTNPSRRSISTFNKLDLNLQ